jgi:acetylornithine deacetylase/succinyl-diaminopimelate desuccinylase-like protein
MYDTIQCVGQYAKNLPAHLRALVKTSVHSDRALSKLEAELIRDPIYSALIGTTQAIDLVQGGVKSNALPEEAWAVINHRVATQRSVFSAYVPEVHGVHPCYPSVAFEQLCCCCAATRYTRFEALG